MNKVSVSTLPMDFDNIGVDLMRVSTADALHVDVMDGKFVPQKTIWTDEVELLKDSELVKDVHLMVDEPENCVEAFVDAGGDVITFHIEATKVPEKVIKKIKDKGAKVAIALNPETPVSKVKKFLKEIDQVLIMSVHPGKGGQSFIPEVLDKVKELRKLREDLDIEVDGGVNAKTAELCSEAGANILCSGSYIFNSEDAKVAIDILRNA